MTTQNLLTGQSFVPTTSKAAAVSLSM